MDCVFHGAEKSQAQLSDFRFHFHFHQDIEHHHYLESSLMPSFSQPLPPTPQG